MWESARLGTIGASLENVVDDEDRGWLVTVADRLGKYPVSGFGSTGESSGVVSDEEKLCWVKDISESSGDCIDDVEDEDEWRSGAL